MPSGFQDARGIKIEEGDELMLMTTQQEVKVKSISLLPQGNNPQFPQGFIKMEGIITVNFTVPYPGGFVGQVVKLPKVEDEKPALSPLLVKPQ